MDEINFHLLLPFLFLLGSSLVSVEIEGLGFRRRHLLLGRQVGLVVRQWLGSELPRLREVKVQGQILLEGFKLKVTIFIWLNCLRNQNNCLIKHKLGQSITEGQYQLTFVFFNTTIFFNLCFKVYLTIIVLQTHVYYLFLEIIFFILACHSTPRTC